MAGLRLPGFGHHRVEPNKPHRFVEPNDAGLGAVASGGFGAGSRPGMNNILLTSAYTRDQAAMPNARCGVRGCGRPHDHAIHEPDGSWQRGW